MTETLPFRTGVCSDYESLLKECLRALQTWKERREDIARFRLQGKQAGDELQRLQANYAKAYNRLERHSKTCAVCRFTTELGRIEQADPMRYSESK